MLYLEEWNTLALCKKLDLNKEVWQVLLFLDPGVFTFEHDKQG